MVKLWASIRKDLLILTRDKLGLTLMFGMPIVLVLVITSIQNSTFELVNENRFTFLIVNHDNGELSDKLRESIKAMGSFRIIETYDETESGGILSLMDKNDAILALVIPETFTADLEKKSLKVTERVMFDFGVSDVPPSPSSDTVNSLKLYYTPVLQESFRHSFQSAVLSALQLVENRHTLETIYQKISNKDLPEELENQLLHNKTNIEEIPASKDGANVVLNATQHNVPAWTIFAMFFIVISLGSGIVREKVSGSFIRLKTMPTSILVSILSKQITYLFVSIAQVIVIFSIGMYLFPVVGLPKLELPNDLVGLLIVSLICGLCALSYALCVGVFSKTQEQANGFGAVSIFILAAIGGLLVPSFAMPESFRIFMILSPLYWCLESFHDLFLEGGKLANMMPNLFPLIIITLFLQVLAFFGLKKKNLI
jgi:ABC-2 type transport system permease protein